MSEFLQRDRLQPSILDRLSDNEPLKRQEVREKRVMSLEKFKQSVIRDLEWLFNTTRLETTDNLDEHPQVKKSVLNLGVPDFAGKPLSSVNSTVLERVIRQTILDFEPRILPRTLKVTELKRNEGNTIVLEIEGDLWWQPIPERLYLKTVLDLEHGNFDIKLDR